MINSARLKAKKNELRKFGLSLAALFLIFFDLLPFFRHRSVSRIGFAFAVTAALFAVIKPTWLIVPQKLWMALGHLLGAVNSKIVLGLVYLGIFTPVALMARRRGKDRLGRSFRPDMKSYRIESQTAPAQQMERIY